MAQFKNGTLYPALNDGDNPFMIMLCGLPASGKSVMARCLEVVEPTGDRTAPVVYSSDATRKELYGDETDQSDPQRVFKLLHKRIRHDLSVGKHVVYDATNLHRKQRRAFLQSLQNIPCRKVCVLMATEYQICVDRNNHRNRHVPQDVMWKMYTSFQPPAYNDGFDDIFIEYTSSELFGTGKMLNRFMKTATGFDQKNQHHAKTLLDHCCFAADTVRKTLPNNDIMFLATLLHDCGKPQTQTYRNAKGDYDGNCHYYGHESVGAYNALFTVKDAFPNMPNDDVLYISNLIAYHMRPYTAWKSSERAYQKDLQICGRAFIEDIELLHRADVAAH